MLNFYKYSWQGIIFWRSSKKAIQINRKHFCAFDLESSTFFNNERIKSEKQYREICYNINKLDKEIIKKFSVAPWCFLCYDEYNGFCAFKSWDDFFKYIEYTKTYLIWDFNAKFDCSFLDYIFYFNPLYSDKDKNKPYFYRNIISVDIQRYTLIIKHDKKIYHINDFSNILRTSIAQMAKDFKIILDNQEVNKKTMDYFKVTWETVTQEDLNYCFNDVYILYNAVKLFDKELKKMSNNFSLINIKKSVPLTCGTIAKSILLTYIYNNKNYKSNRISYRINHPMPDNLDEFYRKNGLYHGGLTFINERYKGIKLNKNIYVYDVNSEYPYVMSQLSDLIGKPYYYSYDDYLKANKKDKYEAILFFSELHMEVKKNMVPSFSYKGDFVSYFNYKSNEQPDNQLLLMFECEFLNIQQFYNIINFKIQICHLYFKGEKIYQKFIYELYQKRQTTKNKTERNLLKLILNSSYGKLGQKIKIPIMEQYLKDDKVTFKIKKINEEIQYEIDKKNKMSVVNAAYITANARCYIRNKIIEVCQPNVAKNFIYCDTDSIHTFVKYNKISSTELGALKLESEAIKGKYLKPKTYLLIDKEDNAKISAKGINKKGFDKYLNNNFFDMFDYERKFYSLTSILVKGGRALILINKNLGVKE